MRTHKTHKTPSHAHKSKLSFSHLSKLKRLSNLPTIPKIYCQKSHSPNQITNIQTLMMQSKPFILVLSDPEDKNYSFFHSSTEKELLKEISQILSHQYPEKIDINSSTNGVFSGDYHQQETISLNFSEFLTYEGESTLYLAQVPLYKNLKESDFYKFDSPKIKNLLSSKLPQINKDQKSSLNLITPFPIKSLLKNQTLDSINLWLSCKPTISDWHYDSYDNFLCLITGTKYIRLLSPRLGNKFLIKRSIKEPFYNQAKEQKRKCLKQIKCKLGKNEAIFIPQGWYHHVNSKGPKLIVALSFWFNSIENIEFFHGREEYFLRFFLRRKCEKEVKRKVAEKLKGSPLENLKKLNGEEIRAFLTKIAKDPTVLKEFLMNLNEYETEFLTSLLEDIDKKIPGRKKIIKKIINGKYADVNGDVSEKIDGFYRNFWGKVDYSYFLEKFLRNKRTIRSKMMKEIIEGL